MTEEEVKELIAELKSRVRYFEIYIGVFNNKKKVVQYYEGKRSEAHFIIEKLKAIFE